MGRALQRLGNFHQRRGQGLASVSLCQVPYRSEHRGQEQTALVASLSAGGACAHSRAAERTAASPARQGLGFWLRLGRG